MSKQCWLAQAGKKSPLYQHQKHSRIDIDVLHQVGSSQSSFHRNPVKVEINTLKARSVWTTFQKRLQFHFAMKTPGCVCEVFLHRKTHTESQLRVLMFEKKPFWVAGWATLKNMFLKLDHSSIFRCEKILKPPLGFLCSVSNFPQIAQTRNFPWLWISQFWSYINFAISIARACHRNRRHPSKNSSISMAPPAVAGAVSFWNASWTKSRKTTPLLKKITP